jgi:hypothetical protein
MIAVSAASAEGQRVPHVPVVFVEGFRTVDTLTRRAAIELRAALAARVAPDRLRVLSTHDIDNYLSTGMPDDFGQAWKWIDVQEMGWAYRADVIIDVITVKQGDRIALRAQRTYPARPVRGSRHRHPPAAAIVALPIVRAATLEQAIDILVRRLAADSVLMRHADQ